MTKANIPVISIKIKPQFNDTVIAFNNSGIVLNKRTYSDLVDLAIMAYQSGNPNLIKLFENLPDLITLQKIKMGRIEENIKKEAQTNKNTKLNAATQSNNKSRKGKARSQIPQ